jgi:short-subunit dehydrogenase
MNLKGRVAVLTGAGSGIGRALALGLARRGVHLALADINPDGLKETASSAAAAGVTVSEHILDVADRDQVAALPRQVIDRHGRVDVLINNAGVALGGTFDRVSEADFDWLMEINFHGVVRMTRAFLPLLHRSDAARIVSISSLYGLIAPPEQTAYSASKFAVRGFSNALRHELEGTTVGVTVVHPGGVATSIARNARIPADESAETVRRRLEIMDRMLRMPPPRAAEIIIRAVEKRQDRVLVGIDAKIVAMLERFFPVHYWRIVRLGIPV